MKTSKHLLFPTDFSEASQDAFISTLHLASQRNAKVTVLHVIYPEYEPMDLPVLSAKATEEKLEVAKTVLENLVSSTRQMLKDQLKPMPEIETKIEIGVPAAGIIRLAKELECDMIAMGTRKKHSTLEQWLGTVTAEVVQKADLPVLVLPEGRHLEHIKLMVFATVLKERDLESIRKLMQLLPMENAIMHVVHVNTQAEKRQISMEDMKRFFMDGKKELPLKFHILESKDVIGALNTFAQEYDADLLIMATVKRSFWERLFHESQSRAMVLRAEIPILVLHE